MTVVAVQIGDGKDKRPMTIEKAVAYRAQQDILRNAREKQVAQMLFTVRAYLVEPDTLVVIKDFIGAGMVNMVFCIMALICAVAWIVGGWWVPMFIVVMLSGFWSALNTPAFNFFMLRLMVRKQGFKGVVRML